MAKKYKTLVMGASYGSLLGTKLAMAGHDTVLVCLPAEVEKINADGALVKMPVRGREGLVEINSRKLPGKVTAAAPGSVDPKEFDLIALAMRIDRPCAAVENSTSSIRISPVPPRSSTSNSRLMASKANAVTRSGSIRPARL